MKRLRHYDKDLAIVISVFGSSEEYAIKQYDDLENSIRQVYQDKAEICVAYSSRTVLKKLQERNQPKLNLLEQLAKLDREGYKKVVVASINTFPTSEHNLIVKMVEAFKTFSPAKYEITAPLFCKAKEANNYIESLDNKVRSVSNVPNILYLAHGTPDLDATGFQSMLYIRELIYSMDNRNYFFAIEGSFKYSLDRFLKQMKKENLPLIGSKDLVIVPLLLVAGNHANSDIEEIAQNLELNNINVIKLNNKFAEGTFSLLSLPETTDYFINQIRDSITKIEWI